MLCTNTHEDLAGTVARAAGYCDSTYPGWAEKLNGIDFRIENGDNCVLYHLEGNYARGVGRIQEVGFGEAFACPDATELWREEIARRLGLEPFPAITVPSETTVNV